MAEPTRRLVLALPALALVGGRPAAAQAPGADALAELLAEEHAAIYLYGVIAPRLPDGLRDRAVASLDDHRRHRDTLLALLRRRDADAPAALSAYAVPAGSPLDVASRIEESLLLRWRAAVPEVPPGDRPVVTSAYADEAAHLTVVRWSGTRDAARAVAAFPGRA